MSQASITALELLRSAEDDVLIQAARHDAKAFAAIYRRYVDNVYRYIYSRVGSQAGAEDLTAQIFLDALEGLNGYRERDTFSAWLFTIAHRRIVDHCRHHRPAFSLDEALDSPAEHPAPLAHLVQEERLRRLADLTHQLDENQQEMLRLRFAAGLTYGEMAQVLGSTEGAVKMAVHRLLRRLESRREDGNA